MRSTALPILLLAALPLPAQDEDPSAQEPPVAQAMTLLTEGDTAAAMELLEPWKDRQDATPELLGLLGSLYLEAGRAEEALDVLGPLAAGEGAEQPAVLYNVGRALRMMGNLPEAVDYLKRSLDLEPISPAVREMGLALGAQRSYEEAYVLLKPWTDGHPEDVEARLAAAHCAVELDRLGEAEQLLSDLPQEMPRVRLLWGRTLLLQADPWGALATLKPLLEETPPEMEVDVRRFAAEAHILVGEATEAAELLQPIAENSPSVSLQLSKAYYQSGDLDNAIDTILPFGQGLLEVPPDQIPRPFADLAGRIAVQCAQLLVSSGNHEVALPYAQLASLLDPDDKQVWHLMGQTLAALGRREEAQEALARFQELGERDAQQAATDDQQGEEQRDPTGRELQKAMELILDGDAGEALEIARREAALAPRDPRPSLVAGRALLAQSNPDAALQAVEESLLIAPENPDGYYLRGVVQMARQELEAAEADYRRALELAPEHTPALNDLAVLLMQQGAEQEARTLLERVLEIRPGDPVAADNLARLENDAG